MYYVINITPGADAVPVDEIGQKIVDHYDALKLDGAETSGVNFEVVCAAIEGRRAILAPIALVLGVANVFTINGWNVSLEETQLAIIPPGDITEEILPTSYRASVQLDNVMRIDRDSPEGLRSTDQPLNIRTDVLWGILSTFEMSDEMHESMTEGGQKFGTVAFSRTIALLVQDVASGILMGSGLTATFYLGSIYDEHVEKALNGETDGVDLGQVMDDWHNRMVNAAEELSPTPPAGPSDPFNVSNN